MDLEIRNNLLEVDYEILRKQFAKGKYRELIQDHIRKKYEMSLAIKNCMEALDKDESEVAEFMIDLFNEMAYEKSFWRRNCGEVFEQIWNMFHVSMSARNKKTEDKIAFNIFQLITINFAKHANEDIELIKFMNIHNNIKNKKLILDYSQQVMKLLSRYILIHDDIFKSKIRRVIPIPGIFETIDFGSHLNGIVTIILELEISNNFIKSYIEKMNEQEQEYLKLLTLYIDALLEAIFQLKVIVGALHAKRQKLVNSTYSWKNYKYDLATYDSFTKDYMMIGDQLNNLFEKVK